MHNSKRNPQKEYWVNLNRSNLLEQIKSKHIIDVAITSLHDSKLAEVNLTYTPVLHKVLQHNDINQQTLTRYNDVTIFDLFQDNQGFRRLVILGEPGAGKTMTLLRLARRLIEDAQTTPDRPIPVIFQLSSWAEKRQSIGEWMVQELQSKYGVNDETLARQWVEDDNIFPLFDGLNEMPYQHRAPCLQAINKFHSPNTEFALCSRLKEWNELHTEVDVVNLEVNAQIQLHPLTATQIEAYLSNLGDDIQSLRRVLNSDEQLQEMATSPLLLNIMVLAYQGVDISSLPKFASISERRKHLFNTYIKRRFETPEADETLATKEQTQTWLKWLAHQMTAHDEKVFLIEGLQPTWLDSDEQQKIYRRRYRLYVGLVVWLGLGLPLVQGLFGSRLTILFGSSLGLIFALALGLVLVIGSVIRFGIGLLEKDDRIVMIHALEFSPKNARGNLNLGLSSGLNKILNHAFIPATTKIKLQPNQGIKSSLNAQLRVSILNSLIWGLVIGLASGLVIGLGFALSLGLASGLSIGLSGGMGIGWSGGMAIGLISGLEKDKGFGIALQHFALRHILQRHGHMPRNYAKFLDYCVSLRLLVRVGGGYKFMHGLLQDHFAELHESDTSTTNHP